MMDDAEDSDPMISVDPELKELLGLFDVPAFARRGQDLEHAIDRIHHRCRAQREDLLEMVRLRLRQWSRAAAGPESWPEVFAAPIHPFWEQTGAEPPRWADRPAPLRQRKAVARDLVASIERFNGRWRRFVGSLNLGPANQVIDQYNKYYVLEKECVMGSARLAARHFTPIVRLSAESLLEAYPTLPVPELEEDPPRAPGRRSPSPDEAI
jgi:hypothetical protein